GLRPLDRPVRLALRPPRTLPPALLLMPGRIGRFSGAVAPWLVRRRLSGPVAARLVRRPGDALALLPRALLGAGLLLGLALRLLLGLGPGAGPLLRLAGADGRD